MQGRLMGKRFQAEYFIESAYKETHSCNYLLATDMEMETVSGYKSTSWEKGYGDYTMKPDLSTLRRVPWLEGTALVLCDVLDHHTHDEVPHSPRAILKKQVARLEAMGMKAYMASELEFFLFDQTYDDARVSGYRDLQLASRLQRRLPHLPDDQGRGCDAGDPQGPAGCWYSGREFQGRGRLPGRKKSTSDMPIALAMADRHAIIKNACKEIAWSRGKAITFLAKWHYNAAGSSSHIHQSLCDLRWQDAAVLR